MLSLTLLSTDSRGSGPIERERERERDDDDDDEERETEREGMRTERLRDALNPSRVLIAFPLSGPDLPLRRRSSSSADLFPLPAKVAGVHCTAAPRETNRLDPSSSSLQKRAFTLENEGGQCSRTQITKQVAKCEPAFFHKALGKL